jgi:hypothetical protein
LYPTLKGTFEHKLNVLVVLSFMVSK